ncbi:MAG: hypothetical protein KAS04_05770 [Candidatus Aenigmarchaeota archaeon]|nr:hypothetical protein [Candidatus Aenigmarchaeota archaeon]
MNKKCTVITRTQHDAINRYFFKWTQEVVDFGKNRGLNIIDIPKERVKRKIVENVINKKKPKFVFFNGHGKSEIIGGHDEDKIIVMGDNDNLLESKIVYSRTCFSAKGIGKKFENSKNGAFIGYNHKYTVPVDELFIARPLNDESAKPFWKTSNIIPISILKGNTVKEALEKSENLYKKYIDFYESTGSPGHMEIAFYLKWNLAIQKCYGNVNESIQN